MIPRTAAPPAGGDGAQERGAAHRLGGDAQRLALRARPAPRAASTLRSSASRSTAASGQRLAPEGLAVARVEAQSSKAQGSLPNPRLRRPPADLTPQPPSP